MTYKMIYLARRNPGLTAEQFPQAWREHSALGRQCPNVQGKITAVAQCSRVLGEPRLLGTSADYDGVNIMALRDLQAARDIWDDDDVRTVMRPDELRVFADHVVHFTLVAEEQEIRPDPQGSFALIGFHARPEAIPANAFIQDWLALLQTQVAQEVLRNQVGRCVANAVALSPPPGYEFDLITEFWFDRLEDMAAMTDSPAGQILLRGHHPDGRIASVTLATQVTHRRP